MKVQLKVKEKKEKKFYAFEGTLFWLTANSRKEKAS